ncbi:hypothetical protein PT974_05271 [Cladobotryum mycophilum]|uniref:Uncharacterized protein n=1 Tax=Cladobotryum mycophilum TaxID=491253 RepID=A0ABR0SI82_9HYPO
MELQGRCYAVERYCILCLNDLPKSSTRGYSAPPERNGFFDWELDVLGFIDMAEDSSLTPQLYTFRTDLADLSFIYHPPLVLSRRGQKVTVRLCGLDSCDIQCDASRPLFFVHVCCWKLARQHHPQLSSLDFYKLARHFQPVVPRIYQPDHDELQFAVFSHIPLRVYTGLEQLISLCADLPTELQRLLPSRILETLSSQLYVALKLLNLKTSQAKPSFKQPLLPFWAILTYIASASALDLLLLLTLRLK